jgi:hypothetical protein
VTNVASHRVRVLLGLANTSPSVTVRRSRDRITSTTGLWLPYGLCREVQAGYVLGSALRSGVISYGSSASSFSTKSMCSPRFRVSGFASSVVTPTPAQAAKSCLMKPGGPTTDAVAATRPVR